MPRSLGNKVPSQIMQADLTFHDNFSKTPFLKQFMSLPYRFKAGGSGAMASGHQPVFHHRNTTKVDHKSFKSKFATKSSLKDRAKGSSARLLVQVSLTGRR